MVHSRFVILSATYARRTYATPRGLHRFFALLRMTKLNDDSTDEKLLFPEAGSRRPRAGSRLGADRALRLLCQIGKSGRVIHRQVRQDLAIQLHARLLQPVNELVVAHPV